MKIANLWQHNAIYPPMIPTTTEIRKQAITSPSLTCEPWEKMVSPPVTAKADAKKLKNPQMKIMAFNILSP